MEAREWILQGQTTQGDLSSAFDETQSGDNFSIHKMYTRLMPQFPRVDWKAIAIYPRIHPRFKFFVWLAVQKRLATVDRLIKLGIQVLPDCAWCGLTLETFGVD